MTWGDPMAGGDSSEVQEQLKEPGFGVAGGLKHQLNDFYRFLVVLLCVFQCFLVAFGGCFTDFWCTKPPFDIFLNFISHVPPSTEFYRVVGQTPLPAVYKAYTTVGVLAHI